jgi:hypothetical protein
LQLAPEPKEPYEQTDKIETGIPSVNYKELVTDKRKPALEDFVFFAAAQRAAEREEDGSM